MPLFQPTVVKKYIAELDKESLNAAWKTFSSHFNHPEIQLNIRAAKEEQYQEGFLRELFVAVLGYTLNPQPNYNLTTEFKNEKDSKKADGAIITQGSIRGVIELKGTDTTDLSKIEKQAFGYLNNHKGCTYVVTSNFEKLRFYIQDATDYEEFNLFTLTKDQFALLYLCLHKDTVLAQLPLTIKQQSVAQEDTVTKKLYADYSRFRNNIFQNLVLLNPQYDQLELFKKTQKLLDRFLFILFAEDRLLLPPNFIIKITEDWKHLQKLRMPQPLYSRFQLYFTDLLNGNKDEDIFAYNGGLFQPDEVLDHLLIDDNLLLEGVLTLSKYDYSSEVDVNILGHIFEHSLNEIENLQASLEATAVDKTKTRRKKEGVFYTPRYITKYIVENTVGTLCTEKKAELEIIDEEYAPTKNKANKKALLQKLDDYRAWLLKLTICDPACGSGAFLNAALEFLITEHSIVDELTNKLMGASISFTWTPNDILENNLFGVDINEEAVEIARLSLWLRTAQKGRKLSNLSNNIKVGNSLIDDAAVAGDKAFIWKEEFKEIFDPSLRPTSSGKQFSGFDVVISNPPYVDVKNLPITFKKFLFQNYSTTENRINLYSTFIEKGLTILSSAGYMSYIIPNSLLTNSSYKKLRFLIYDSLVELIKLPDNTFIEAKVETIILILKKSNQESLISVLQHKKEEQINIIDKDRFLKFDKKDWQKDENLNFNFYSSSLENGVLNKIERNTTSLIDICDFSLGLTPYDKYKGHTKEEIINRVFHSKTKIDEQYKPLITGENIVRYYTQPHIEEYIKYGNWLSRPREARFFLDERIIIRQIVSGNPPRVYASYANEAYYFTHHGFAIIPKKEPTLKVKYLLTLINSTLLNFYHANKFLDVEKRLFQKVLIENYKRLPIKITENQQPFTMKADIMLSRNKELQETKHGLLNLLQSKYVMPVISKKLSNWPTLSFKDFLKELEKCKIKLSLSEQKEWLQYFGSEKEKAVTIQNIITQTDAEIDKMVYALYELTEEEIAVVEGRV